jgi:putative MATE family efflux protein
MRIRLSDHFNYPRLLRFVLPSIVMMLFTSVYSVVDGLFVSNFVGKTSFAAVNLMIPVLMGMSAVGFLFGTGGSALVSRTLGEGDREGANTIFSMIVAVTALCGVIATTLGIALTPWVARALGAEGEFLSECIRYGRIVMLSQGPFMLQCVFQSFFVTAEKPKLGLTMTIAAGVMNIFLDAVLVGWLRLGITGAGIATVCSEMTGGLLPVVYFLCPNSSLLRIVRPRFHGKNLLRVVTNGASELMTNLSMPIVNTLYNLLLMRMAGENGVAAYGVLLYVNFFFSAVTIGYSIGSAPLFGYHYGAANDKELQNLFRKSFVLIGAFSLALTLIAQGIAAPLARVFVGYDETLCAMTERGFSLYSLSFALAGFNIFASSLFTALGNGLVSAVISCLRTLLFQIAALLLLPLVLGLDGVWLAVVAAEASSLLVTAGFLISKKGTYHYA